MRFQKLYFLSRISKYVSFWLFLLKEIHIRKRSIFWQKPETYPFGKCRFFSTMWELPTFEVQKTLFSIQNIKKCFFHAFLLKKELIRKGRFFDKNHGLTPLQNVDFLAFFATFLLLSKKHSFLSRIWKNVSFCHFLLKKNIWENGRFFDKNHGLTPLQNVDILWFC